MGHGQDQILFTIICFPLFMIAIAMHELAHGYVALLYGDPTAKYAGRISLNPIVHMDPIGTLCFVLSSMSGIGFGWAKPVPINPVLFKNYRGGIIAVSLAGVGANFALLILGACVLKILIVTGLLEQISNPALLEYIVKMIKWFISFNLLLFVFNLVPIPPLDGSKVAMMLLPREMAVSLERIEPYGMFIIFALLFTGILGKLFEFAANIVFPILQFVFRF